MAERLNFLLGKGERLTERVLPAGRKVERGFPYTFEQAREHVAPMVEAAAEDIERLPPAACPNDEAVGAIVLNPEYLAMSYYPGDLLHHFDLRAVGSRPTYIKPRGRSNQRTPVDKPTTQLFVAGRRESFRRFADAIPRLKPNQLKHPEELGAVETFALPRPNDKIKPIASAEQQIPLEVVLHASAFQSDHYILRSFKAYVASIGLQTDIDKRLYAGGLCFLRMRAPRQKLDQLARFSFLRAVREMPKLRVFDPAIRGLPAGSGSITISAKACVDAGIRVAIFDGGVPKSSPLTQWVRAYDAPGVGPAVPLYLEHGHAVTSAALFGHLQPGSEAPQPYVNVDHYRVLDVHSVNDPLELHDVIDRIRTVLETSPRYDFINVSIGPRLPVEDDDIHAWTAVIDEYLANAKTVAMISVGNDGELDSTERLNRIQVPADCVNAVSVGACDKVGVDWKRAPYSSVGPSRSPGIVKPDVVAFGGSIAEPFLIVGPSSPLSLAQTAGTSFAAPYVLRAGAAVRAHFGSLLEPLAIRALLIHTAKTSNLPQAEVGWGRISDGIDNIVLCKPGMVRVVYQGELSASKYTRARLPMPKNDLTGMVNLSITCCFATEIDSAHAGNYTRSGIEILFRPNEDVFADDDSVHPKAEPLFSQSRLYTTEDELRRDAHKWETCLHVSKRKRASSLKNPVLDLHYLARDEGHTDRRNDNLSYALIVTVEAPKHKNLYDEIVRTYRNTLEPMRPQVQIRVTPNP